jgi:hypothetical protein
MPWKIAINAEQAFIEVELSGNITSPEFDQLTNQIIDLAQNNSIYYAYFDCHMVTGGLDVHDVITFTRALTPQNGGSKLRSAIRTSSEPILDKNFQFWETCCFNRGLVVKLFDDRVTAFDWLMN